MILIFPSNPYVFYAENAFEERASVLAGISPEWESEACKVLAMGPSFLVFGGNPAPILGVLGTVVTFSKALPISGLSEHF